MSDVITQLPLIVHMEDIKLREVVGCGSFSTVYRVTFRNESGSFSNSMQTLVREQSWSSFKVKSALSNSKGDEDLDEYDTSVDGASESTECSSFRYSFAHPPKSSPNCRSKDFTCVLKRLNVDQFTCLEAKENALKGIRFEAKVLVELVPPHDHIVRIYGISSNFFELERNCFIILEYMEITLEKRIIKWNAEKRSRHVDQLDRLLQFMRQFWKFDKDAELTMSSDHACAIRIGLAIAKALQHLHKHHILYRDLKPSNVGLDALGNVRIFDFDLSRVCGIPSDTSSTTLEPNRLHTQCVGSIRYMSPECATSTNYDFPSDVYSFAIVLWETLTLQRAFLDARDHVHFYRMVFHRHVRPSLRTVHSSNLKSLLRVCWNPNPSLRPTFSCIVAELERLQAMPSKYS